MTDTELLALYEQQRHRPWNADFKEGDDPVDYERWCMWMRGRLADFYPVEFYEPDIEFDELEIVTKVALFCLMCELADERQE